nr:VanZ family protein [Streptomyces coryli]
MTARSFRAAGAVLIGVHLAAVWWVALRPASVPWVYASNLTPLATIRIELEAGGWQALRAIGGSLLLLAPLGFLLPLAQGRLMTASPLGSLVRTVLAGLMLSVVIEMLKTGIPGQVANVDTVLLNVAGVALAHAAVVPAVRAWLRRPRGSVGGSQGEPREFPGSGSLAGPMQQRELRPYGGITVKETG